MILFLEAEETVCCEEDISFEAKELPKKKRPYRDIDSMPQRTKRQKYSEEGVTSSDFEELESTDQNDESGDMKETIESDENDEGT